MEEKKLFDKEAFVNSILISKLTKNSLEELRFSLLKNNLIDVRIHFYFPGLSEPKPTKKGIWLSFDQVKNILQVFEKFVKNEISDLDFEMERSEKEKIKVYTGKFKGKKIAHIRLFYLKKDEFNPGKGVSFPISLINEVTESFKKVMEYNK
ncbi:MAG: PC4/YdbC family ssDNA-binding protein [Elusimicrobia bacterium]|nr:PC4/YdbC family ssDNA-binding protein [Elusimicrobiota bacterium]